MTSLRNKPVREDLVTQAVLEVYGAVRHEGRLADRALEHSLRPKKHLYSSERRAVAERVYAMLRRQRLIDLLGEKRMKGFQSASTSHKDLARLAIARVLEGDDVSAVLQGVGWSGAEGKWLRALGAEQLLSSLPPVERFEIEASVPPFFAAQLLGQLKDEAWDFARAMNQRGPLTVRTNTLKITREELQKRLEGDEVEVTPTELSPFGLTLQTRTNVTSLTAFRDGLFEVQDEGSQLLGMLVDAPPRTVIDACAGAGGKTLQLAAQMKNRGELHALDVDERRLEELKLRARRAGAHNVRIKAISPGVEAEAELEGLKDKAERVMVDAPCSGSGTWRRKPDARLRLTEASVAEHVERQRTLLERFSGLVKPNGRLIYGTCSVLRAENEEVIEHFLGKHPEFTVAPAVTWLGEALAEKTTSNGMLRLFPHRHGTDGFFGAVLVRAQSKQGA